MISHTTLSAELSLNNQDAIRRLLLLAGLFLFVTGAWGGDTPRERPAVHIPRIEHAPLLEDFLPLDPDNLPEIELARVGEFLQRTPRDGDISSQRTEVYLGYDAKNLYVIFISFDSEPDKIRARMLARGTEIFDDDFVSVQLDTFYDQRRAYSFSANPLGIQNTGVWIEGQGWDYSFDTIWEAKGKRTKQGYVVLLTIPFRSLRFPSASSQTWGLMLQRNIPRTNEKTYWPSYSSRIEGLLNQAARMTGIQQVSPGRNIQLIPYGVFRSFRALDARDPSQPRYVQDNADPRFGLDAKFILKDSIVLDATINPDFSQVESDEPQVTVNQRFEVFFPEKRPFFLENANFFQTPINLLFSRRIADPEFGFRLTGKLGPYAIGALFTDDRSAGKTVPDNSPLFGKRAHVGVFRASRDIWKQSSMGFIYTERTFEGSSNRVGGLDGRFKVNQNWAATLQAVTSSTRNLDGSSFAGPAYEFALNRSGRQLNYNLTYQDRSPGFRTHVGFDPRPDIRSLKHFVTYRFRPEGKLLVSWGPDFVVNNIWDHSGTRLESTFGPALKWEMTRQTTFGVYYLKTTEGVRPKDFPVLTQTQNFSESRRGVMFSSSFLPQVTIQGLMEANRGINFVPVAGEPPTLGRGKFADLALTLRPVTSLTVTNTYIRNSLSDLTDRAFVFRNQILRSKWNYQITRELSARVILQYDSVQANPAKTSIPTRKNFNADFLIRYFLNYGTALFIGYNSNLQNPDPALRPGFQRSENRFVNDAKQFFIKFSYSLRF